MCQLISSAKSRKYFRGTPIFYAHRTCHLNGTRSRIVHKRLLSSTALPVKRVALIHSGINFDLCPAYTNASPKCKQTATIFSKCKQTADYIEVYMGHMPCKLTSFPKQIDNILQRKAKLSPPSHDVFDINRNENDQNE